MVPEVLTTLFLFSLNRTRVDRKIKQVEHKVVKLCLHETIKLFIKCVYPDPLIKLYYIDGCPKVWVFGVFVTVTNEGANLRLNLRSRLLEESNDINSHYCTMRKWIYLSLFTCSNNSKGAFWH